MTKEAQPAKARHWRYDISDARSVFEDATTNEVRAEIIKQAQEKGENKDKALKPAPARDWKRFYHEALMQLAQRRKNGDQSIKAFLEDVDDSGYFTTSVLIMELTTSHGPQRFATKMQDFLEDSGETEAERVEAFLILPPFTIA